MSMKKRLIIANTYYQLILAIQMRSTLFLNDNVSLILTDHSNNAKEIFRKLKEKHFFDNCYFVESKDLDTNYCSISKIVDAVRIAFGLKCRYSIYSQDIIDTEIDELIFFNVKLIEYESVFSTIYKKNKGIRVSLYEEGILSYNQRIVPSRRRNIINFFRKLSAQDTMLSRMDKFYCTSPQIYNGTLVPVQIPLIGRKSISLKILADIFDIKETKFPEKYIFFTSVYDFEGETPIGEYELVCKVAETVGKENLIIKTHPRDSRNIYEDNGFNVVKNSSAPWEVIQLLGDFTHKIYLSINSGSVLAGSLLSEIPIKTFYLYKLCDINKNTLCKKNAIDIERLLEKDVCREVKVARDVADIL